MKILKLVSIFVLFALSFACDNAKLPHLERGPAANDPDDKVPEKRIPTPPSQQKEERIDGAQYCPPNTRNSGQLEGSERLGEWYANHRSTLKGADPLTGEDVRYVLTWKTSRGSKRGTLLRKLTAEGKPFPDFQPKWIQEDLDLRGIFDLWVDSESNIHLLGFPTRFSSLRRVVLNSSGRPIKNVRMDAHSVSNAFFLKNGDVVVAVGYQAAHLKKFGADGRLLKEREYERPDLPKDYYWQYRFKKMGDDSIALFILSDLRDRYGLKVMRFDRDLELDKEFGSDGLVELDDSLFGVAPNTIKELERIVPGHSFGRSMILGVIYQDTTIDENYGRPNKLVIGRIKATGEVDKEFGENGAYAFKYKQKRWWKAITARFCDDGRSLWAFGDTGHVFLVQLTKSGRPDPKFNKGRSKSFLTSGGAGYVLSDFRDFTLAFSKTGLLTVELTGHRPIGNASETQDQWAVARFRY